MKKLLFFLVVLFVVAYSCKKKTTPFTFNVNNIADMTISSDTTVYFPVQVVLLTGAQETVTLAISGLPTGVTAVPSTASGIPTFTTTFTLTCNHAIPGTYKITVTATSPSGGAKKYDFNMTVVQSNCVPRMTGSYSGTDACTSGPYTYTATATSSSTSGVLIVNNFGSFGTSSNLNFTLHCGTDSITVPKQNVWANTWVRGHGSFTSNTMTVRYALIDSLGTVTDSCTAVLTK
ncbi:MAG: hypothetical protein K0Q79_1915 [Flavipsychrobacter sp.]|jgi:uncharacterized membrane protein|nr:hypothetical protein [Flavipsychrobacter sp.]